MTQRRPWTRGKEEHLQFGRYSEITLKVARDRRLEARRALELGKDPGAIQKAERLARSATVEAVATEWLEIQRDWLVTTNSGIIRSVFSRD
jgi:hypothetical protein